MEKNSAQASLKDILAAQSHFSTIMAGPVGDRITRHGGDVAEPVLWPDVALSMNRLVEIRAYQVGVLILLVLKRHTLDLIAWVLVDPHSVTQSEVSSVGRFSRHLFVVPPGPALPIMSQTGIACRPELDSPAAAAISHFGSFNVTLFLAGERRARHQRVTASSGVGWVLDLTKGSQDHVQR